ncbi:LPXTG cell wall anchor domain-containing protein [Propionimicrobium lymphophilum]
MPGLPRTGNGGSLVALLGLAALTATALVARKKN